MPLRRGIPEFSKNRRLPPPATTAFVAFPPHHQPPLLHQIPLPRLSLGWEFQFLVPISGTPIVSGIPILFLVPKIPDGFFFEIPMSGESENWNSDLQNSEFR
jgi:hypothetical protein